jgi:hypothetical protein
MDIFRDYFTREELLSSISKAPYIPGRLAQEFETRALTSTTLALEEDAENAPTLITAVPRGTPSRIETLEKRKVHTFVTSHYRVDGSVYADEVLNMRGAGVANAVEVITQRRDALLMRMRRDIDLLHESLRVACLVTPTNAFGTIPATQAIAFQTDATKTRAEILNKIIIPIENALKGLPFSGIRALCSDSIFDDVIENAAIKATYEGWSMAQSLRNDPRETVNFGGVTFERYRGTRVYPEGVPGMFVQAFAPADTLDTVGSGQMGTPYHPQSITRPDNRGWYFEIQTNCVMVCTRPTAVLAIDLS